MKELTQDEKYEDLVSLFMDVFIMSNKIDKYNIDVIHLMQLREMQIANEIRNKTYTMLNKNLSALIKKI
jgi:rhamnogalacturonyl hydrolase YesR